MNRIRFYVGVFALLVIASALNAQQRVTLSGYVKEMDSGETLIGANVYVKDNPAKGAATNAVQIAEYLVAHKLV